MEARATIVGAVLALALAGGERPPAEIGMTETTGTRLAQLDVTVTGPPDALASIGPEDFRLWVGGRHIADFLVDDACGTMATSAQGPAATGPVPGPRPTTYLLYFDGPQLTMSGRQRALDLAREMASALLEGGNRAMVVSNGVSLAVMQDLTSDPDVLRAAIDRVEADEARWDPAAALEDLRIEQLERLLRDQAGVDGAVPLAVTYQREEAWRAERDLARLSTVLGRLGEIDPPKVVLYFADTMRQKAGEHYLQAVSTARGVTDMIAAADRHHALDRVLHLAASLGVRFYPVQADGMAVSSLRLRDAQSTLAAFALETGGRAFLNGVGPKRMLAEIRRDLGCLYLLSFDPGDFPLDRPLPVRVELDVPRVRVSTRGQLVLQGESARRATRLLSAFTSAAEARPGAPLRAELVPLGHAAGAFSALLQVTIPPTEVAGTEWDVGASLVSRGEVVQDGAARIRVGGRGVPVIWERTMAFGPGPFEIVAVAQEARTERVLSTQVASSWPDPAGAPATIGPLAVLQPVAGAFSRDGVARRAGTLAHGPDDPVRPDRPTALVALVCRRPGQGDAPRVTTRLVGASTIPLAEVEIEDACVQVRDVIRAGTLGEGEYSYEVSVEAGGRALARAARTFRCIAAEAGSAGETLPR